MNISDFFGKDNIENILIDDIQTLIDNNVPENLYLDYKKEMWGQFESSNKEISRDISSFANAHGGFIILGIEEDNDGNPERMTGVEDVDKNILRIRQVCHSGIQPVITGMKIHAVRINENKSIILIYIPDSLGKPHMVLQDYRCYMRYERGKNPINIYQIEELIKSRAKNTQKVKEFLEKRNSELQKYVKNNSAMCFSVLPHVLEKERFDIFSSQTEKAIEVFISKGIVRGKFLPTFDGFTAFEGNQNTIYRQIVIQSTGYIELFLYIPYRDTLPVEWFQNQLNLFLESASIFYSRLDLDFRGWFHTGFFNMINFTLKLPDNLKEEEKNILINKDGYFFLPDISFEYFVKDSEKIKRAANDFLWRKFGFNRSLL
ncbi:MAG: AlbA family DNA-binding domain-containing protein [Candidatus Muiribacteriota bacterium]